MTTEEEAVRLPWKRKYVPFDFARFAAKWPAPTPAGSLSLIHTPSEVEVLARYNAERARGILHTFEWQERMAELQRRFDEARAEGRP
jgi:hypothetical protein